MDLMNWVGEINWATPLVSALVGLVSVVITNMFAWARFKRAHRLEDRTELVLRRLLKDKRFKRRKFETIKSFVPLSDEKLREALIRAGAVQILGDNDVYWGLLEKHKDRVFPKG